MLSITSKSIAKHYMEAFIELLSQPQTYISLLTLSLMEIVLGIDNIVFISIVVAKLPEAQQKRARNIGILLALVFRVILLFCISWIVGLTNPLFHIFSHGVSGRDLVLIGGGLFLIAKSTSEIHGKFEPEAHSDGTKKIYPTLLSVIGQVVILDIVFSFDSVITAVGLVKEVPIMITAVIISLIVMLIFAKAVSDFVNHHPTVKMLALSFLLMIGALLVAEGFHQEIPKGYVYFAMAFSLFVECLNLKVRKNHTF